MNRNRLNQGEIYNKKLRCLTTSENYARCNGYIKRFNAPYKWYFNAVITLLR